jgi:hypothetical protein
MRLTATAVFGALALLQVSRQTRKKSSWTVAAFERNYVPQVPLRRVGRECLHFHKAPRGDRRALPHPARRRVFRKNAKCLAGDAVLIAPVSKKIPWYQGILQGILRFRGLETRFSTEKPLRGSHFSSNSLRRLSGKIFWGLGNFLTVSGNSGKHPFLAYVERPARQGLFQTVHHPGTVRSYVRPFSAA